MERLLENGRRASAGRNLRRSPNRDCIEFAAPYASFRQRDLPGIPAEACHVVRLAALKLGYAGRKRFHFSVHVFLRGLLAAIKLPLLVDGAAPKAAPTIKYTAKSVASGAMCLG
jgi:hypothetical protein